MADGFAHALFGDDELARLFTEAAEVHSMVAVEAALARVEGKLGLIPAEAATTIEHAQPAIDFASLRAGMEASGVPTIALLVEFRKALDDDAASALHFGATSQDVMDTGLVLRLRDAFAILDLRLKEARAYALAAGAADDVRRKGGQLGGAAHPASAAARRTAAATIVRATRRCGGDVVGDGAAGRARDLHQPGSAAQCACQRRSTAAGS